MDNNKDFVVLGNINSIIYKEIFPYIKENKIELGYSVHSGDMEFKVSDDYSITTKNLRIDSNENKYRRLPGIRWFTTIKQQDCNNNLMLFDKYNPELYPKYDNYDAINVDKTCDIPDDYDGLMGVPISFMDKYNPKQFEIVDGINRYSLLKGMTTDTKGKFMTNINGIPKYARVIIKKL